MSCRLWPRRRSDIFWNFLLGTTFLFCSLLIYQFLVFKGIICSSQSPCFKSSDITAEKFKSEECSSMCDTKECIDISNFILSNMNQSADPCEDFYNFACGNFDERFRSDGNHSVLDQLTVELHKIIRDVIETSEGAHGSAMHKLKVVYESCLDPGSSEFTSVKEILLLLKYVGIPNWPHLSSNFTFQRRPSLPEVLGRLSTYQEDVFVRIFDSYHGEDRANGRLYNLTVSPHYPTFQDDTEVKEVKRIVKGILDFMDLSAEEINKTLEEFIAVDTRIYSLLITNSEGSSICEEKNSTEFTVFDCSHGSPNSWHFLCGLVESVIRNSRMYSRYTRDQLLVPCEFRHYVDRIFDLINTYKDRVVANYIALRVFINNLKYMNFYVRKNLKLFIRLPTDSAEDHVIELDRWKFCVSWIADNMQYPLGMMYVSNMWPTQAADELNEIVHQFVMATKVFISRQRWIGDSTKEQILKEIDEEENCIYYVIEGMKNETKIDTLYKRFHPVRSNFMRNVLNHKKFIFIASKLYAKEMSYFLEHRPFIVNAYGGDDIYLTFGILLPPVFRYGYPNLFNVAKIGQIIGHELGHKLYFFFEHSVDMDKETHENFDGKKKCLIDQYHNFELKRIKKFVQGNQTITENFPDNMGLQVTEKVSEMYLQDMRSRSFTLPGLSYSPDELLYISYAQMWCTVRSVEKEKEHYERDFHSPPEFRIKGTLQNSRRFSQVFNCSAASFMNAGNRCSIFE